MRWTARVTPDGPTKPADVAVAMAAVLAIVNVVDVTGAITVNVFPESAKAGLVDGNTK